MTLPLGFEGLGFRVEEREMAGVGVTGDCSCRSPGGGGGRRTLALSVVRVRQESHRV